MNINAVNNNNINHTMNINNTINNIMNNTYNYYDRQEKCLVMEHQKKCNTKLTNGLRYQ